MALTAKMKTGARLYAENPFVTEKEICEQIGISQQNFCRWKKKQEWNNLVDEILKEEWHDASRKAQKQMQKLSDEGDFKATQYILDSAGYKAPEQIELKQEVIKVTIDD